MCNVNIILVWGGNVGVHLLGSTPVLGIKPVRKVALDSNVCGMCCCSVVTVMILIMILVIRFSLLSVICDAFDSNVRGMRCCSVDTVMVLVIISDFDHFSCYA